MTLDILYRYLMLLTYFRNGWRLVRALRGGPPAESASLWDGTRLVHPSGQAGLVEAICEIWVDECYTRDFYDPVEGDVIVDAGANVGLFSVWCARHNPRCRVVALEPFPPNFTCLERNLAAARTGNVKPLCLALGFEAGKGSMMPGPRSLDASLSITGFQDAEVVSVVPLAELLSLAETDRLALLKMDIEGSEAEVFAGASLTDLKRIDRLVIEFHDHLRPGTSALIHERLHETHTLRVQNSSLPGCGLLFATRLSGRTVQ